jgi:hypothetical protein
MGYMPSAWGGRGEALAAVAGALTGLLFVALSVKGAALSQSRPLASRAAQTLVLFMTSVIIALMLVAPQPATAVGAELLALVLADTDRRSEPHRRCRQRLALPRPPGRLAWCPALGPECRGGLTSPADGRWPLSLVDDEGRAMGDLVVQ